MFRKALLFISCVLSVYAQDNELEKQVDELQKVRRPKESLLHTATQQSTTSVELIEHLIANNNILVTELDDQGVIAPAYAAVVGNFPVLRYLLEKYPEVLSYRHSILDWSFMHFAVINGKREMIDYLIEKGFSPHSANKYGYTPLHIACIYGSVSGAKILIEEYKVDANCRTVQGLTPLMCAAQYGHPMCIQYLLEREEVNPEIQDAHGATFKQYALKQPRVVQYLTKEFELEIKIPKPKTKDSRLYHMMLTGASPRVHNYLMPKARPEWVNRRKACSQHSSLRFSSSDSLEESEKLFLERFGSKSPVYHSIIELQKNKKYTNSFQEVLLHVIASTGESFLATDTSGLSTLEQAAKLEQPFLLDSMIAAQNITVDKPLKIKLLTQAILGKRKAVIKYLVKKYGLDAEDVKQLGCPLGRMGSIELLELILSSVATTAAERKELAQLLFNENDHAKHVPLQHAAFNGHKSFIKYVVKKYNVRPDVLSQSGTSALYFATKAGYLDTVKLFIEELGCDSKQSYGKQGTLLHAAVEDAPMDPKTRRALLKYLVEDCGLSVAACDDFGCLPIHIAAINGHKDAVKFFYEHDPNLLSALSKSKYSLLHYSILAPTTSMLEYLVTEMKLDPHIKHPITGETLLHFAIKGGTLDHVKLIVEKLKVDINSVDNQLKTPLIYAAQYNKPEALVYLLEAKANVLAKDKLGKSVLTYAQNQKPLVEILQKYGFIFNNREPKPKQPRSCAAMALTQSQLTVPKVQQRIINNDQNCIIS